MMLINTIHTHAVHSSENKRFLLYEIICIINSNIFTFLTHCEALYLKTTGTNMSEDECFKIIYTDFQLVLMFLSEMKSQTDSIQYVKCSDISRSDLKYNTNCNLVIGQVINIRFWIFLFKLLIKLRAKLHLFSQGKKPKL